MITRVRTWGFLATSNSIRNRKLSKWLVLGVLLINILPQVKNLYFKTENSIKTRRTLHKLSVKDPSPSILVRIHKKLDCYPRLF